LWLLLVRIRVSVDWFLILNLNFPLIWLSRWGDLEIVIRAALHVYLGHLRASSASLGLRISECGEWVYKRCHFSFLSRYSLLSLPSFLRNRVLKLKHRLTCALNLVVLRVRRIMVRTVGYGLVQILLMLVVGRLTCSSYRLTIRIICLGGF